MLAFDAKLFASAFLFSALFAGILLADSTLVLVALLPTTISLVTICAFGPSLMQWHHVAGLVAVSLIWSWSILRSFPRDSLGMPLWLWPAMMAVISRVLYQLTVSGYIPPLWNTVAAALLVCCIVQYGVILIAHRLFQHPWKQPPLPLGQSQLARLTRARYRYLAPRIRFWVRGKLAWDPLFKQLRKHFNGTEHLLDFGCGYGLTSVWLGLQYPSLRITAFDPLRSRLRICHYALEKRATVLQATAATVRTKLAELAAPHRPLNGKYDCILCADVIHHIADPLEFLRQAAWLMKCEGRLLLRTTIRIGIERKDETSVHFIERLMVFARLQRTVSFYTREQVESMLASCGLQLVQVDTTPGKNETLFVAVKHRPSRLAHSLARQFQTRVWHTRRRIAWSDYR